MDTTALVWDKEDPTEEFRANDKNLFNAKKESTAESRKLAKLVDTWKNRERRNRQ